MVKSFYKLVCLFFIASSALFFASCSENNEAEPEPSIYGTWRRWVDKAENDYWQITIKPDGTLIWEEVNEHENEYLPSKYDYLNGILTWYELEDGEIADVEARWEVKNLTYRSMTLLRIKANGDACDEKDHYSGTLFRVE